MTELAAHAVTLRYGARTVLDGVDLAVRGGEVLGLIGPNGAGKSSLLRVMAGLASPAAGAVHLDGHPLAAVPPRERARRIAWLAQGAECHWPLTVERLVALGRLPHLGPWQRPEAGDAAAIARALDACDAARFRDRVVTTLSGGERARVLLARALATETDLLLADEPVAGLDPFHQLQVMQVLSDSAANGTANGTGTGTGTGTGIIVVLHDLILAARFCGRLALLDHGRVVADGPPEVVLDPRLLERVYGVRVIAGELEGRRVIVPWERCAPPPLPPRG